MYLPTPPRHEPSSSQWAPTSRPVNGPGDKNTQADLLWILRIMLVACSHLGRSHANFDVGVLLLLFVYRPAYPPPVCVMLPHCCVHSLHISPCAHLFPTYVLYFLIFDSQIDFCTSVLLSFLHIVRLEGYFPFLFVLNVDRFQINLRP